MTIKNHRKGHATPKGRQVDDAALAQVRALLEGQGLAGRQIDGRDLLIEHLHRLQDHFGHLSPRHLRALAEVMRLSMAEIYEVASFYAHFDVLAEGDSPPPALTVRVCDSLACQLAGAEALHAALKSGLDATQVRVLRAPCIGRCDAAPAVTVGQNAVGNATADSVSAAISTRQSQAIIPDYQSLEEYRAHGGYDTIARLRIEADRDENFAAVQQTLLESGLRGMGGAGFPTGRKWGIVRAETGPRYVVVNADEGEPGTFKDRVLMARAPHLFLEGMLIAAWAIQARASYIYLRDEYPEIRAILLREIAALQAAGLVAPGDIVLRRGAGAYICGEESALIESLEGKRGLPRHRPPYVAQAGLFGCPTLVHNVETLTWATRVLREGPEVLNGTERNGRRGLRHYSVSGRVARPGVYLLAAGSTIRDVIAAAGGMAPGHVFKAYQPGGPSAGLLPASLDDVALDFDTLQPHGSFIGSAAVVVLSDRDSARAAALNMLRFFEHESCGQCTPCRVGCEKAVKLMQAAHWDQGLLEELCTVMADASICGLGQAAPNAIRLTMRHFPDEV